MHNYVQTADMNNVCIHSNFVSQDIFYKELHNFHVKVNIDSIKEEECYPGFSILHYFKRYVNNEKPGVYLCRDNDVYPPRYYALKRFNLEDHQCKDFEKIISSCKFCCETQINKKLGNDYFTIMDYIPGFHLRDCIEKDFLPKDSVKRCLVDFKIICSFASQMITLVENNVYHPDISFNNLVIDNDFYGHLIDFQNDLKTLGTLCCVVPFRYPERENLTKSGLMMYSFGATLYKLLSGEYIFKDMDRFGDATKLYDDTYQKEENLKKLLPYQQKLFTELIYPICFCWDDEENRNPEIIKDILYKIVKEFVFKENFGSREYDDSFIYELNEILYFCFEESKIKESPRIPQFWGSLQEIRKFYENYKQYKEIDEIRKISQALEKELNLFGINK